MNDEEWSEVVLRKGLGRIAEWSTPGVPDIASVGVSSATLEGPGRRPVPVWLAAAAVVVIGVAGLVWISVARDDGAPLDPAVPATQPPDQPDQAPVVVAARGLFPTDGSAYDDPVDLVTAYMADRTAPANLPPDYTVTATVGEARPVDDRLSAVAVSLQTPDDSGDATVLVRRFADDTWAVTAAAVFGDELIGPTLDDGMLTATLATRAGGITYVAAHDASSGALVASATVRAAVTTGVEPADPQALQLDVGTTSAVALRYWNIVDPVEAYAFANFAELIVTSDLSPIVNDWSLFSQPASTVPVDEPGAGSTSSIGVLGWADPANPDTVALPALARKPTFVSGPPAEATIWLFTDDEGRRCVEVQQLGGSQAGQCVDADTQAALEATTSNDNDGSTYVIGTTADATATAVVAVTGDRRQPLTLHPVDGWDVRVFAGRFTEPPQQIELIGPTGTAIATDDL